MWGLILSTWQVLEPPKHTPLGMHMREAGSGLCSLQVHLWETRLGPLPVNMDSVIPWVGFLDWIKRKMLSTDVIVFYFLTVDLMWPFVFCLVLHTFLPSGGLCPLEAIKQTNPPFLRLLPQVYVRVTRQVVRKRDQGKLGNGNRSFKANKYKIVFFEMTLESNDKKGNMNIISAHGT